MVSGPSHRPPAWGRREVWAYRLCQAGGLGLGRGSRGLPPARCRLPTSGGPGPQEPQEPQVSSGWGGGCQASQQTGDRQRALSPESRAGPGKASLRAGRRSWEPAPGGAVEGRARWPPESSWGPGGARSSSCGHSLSPLPAVFQLPGCDLAAPSTHPVQAPMGPSSRCPPSPAEEATPDARLGAHAPPVPATAAALSPDPQTSLSPVP